MRVGRIGNRLSKKPTEFFPSIPFNYIHLQQAVWFVRKPIGYGGVMLIMDLFQCSFIIGRAVVYGCSQGHAEGFEPGIFMWLFVWPVFSHRLEPAGLIPYG